MIQLEATTNASRLIEELVAVELLLADATAVLDIIERELPNMLADRFSKFQRYRGTYAKKNYLEWKSTHLGVGLVGVYSWDLFTSLQSGSAIEYERTKDLGYGTAIHATLNTSKFRDHYPVYFDKWLRSRGDELMALDAPQVQELAEKIVEMLSEVLDGIL